MAKNYIPLFSHELEHIVTRQLSQSMIWCVYRRNSNYVFELIRNQHIRNDEKKLLVDMFRKERSSEDLTRLVAYVRAQKNERLLSLLLSDDSYPRDAAFQNLLVFET